MAQSHGDAIYGLATGIIAKGSLFASHNDIASLITSINAEIANRIAADNNTLGFVNATYAKLTTNVFTSSQNYTEANKGIVTSGTVTFDRSAGDVQKLQVGGALSVALAGWPAFGTYGGILLEIINGGAFVLTFPTIKWILPDTGAAAASFSAYLTAIGRTSSSLQVSGSDFLYLWSTDGGATVFGKIM